MDRIHAVSLFPSIPTGSLDEFKHILSELKTLTESETGTLEWQWFLSADETQCIVFESFADSTAVLTHIDNAGGRGARLVARRAVRRERITRDAAGFPPIRERRAHIGRERALEALLGLDDVVGHE